MKNLSLLLLLLCLTACSKSNELGDHTVDLPVFLECNIFDDYFEAQFGDVFYERAEEALGRYLTAEGYDFGAISMKDKGYTDYCVTGCKCPTPYTFTVTIYNTRMRKLEKLGFEER